MNVQIISILPELLKFLRNATFYYFTTSTFSMITASRGRSRKSVTTAPIRRTTFIPSTILPKIA